MQGESKVVKFNVLLKVLHIAPSPRNKNANEVEGLLGSSGLGGAKHKLVLIGLSMENFIQRFIHQ